MKWVLKTPPAGCFNQHFEHLFRPCTWVIQLTMLSLFCLFLCVVCCALLLNWSRSKNLNECKKIFPNSKSVWIEFENVVFFCKLKSFYKILSILKKLFLLPTNVKFKYWVRKRQTNNFRQGAGGTCKKEMTQFW